MRTGFSGHAPLNGMRQFLGGPFRIAGTGKLRWDGLRVDREEPGDDRHAVQVFSNCRSFVESCRLSDTPQRRQLKALAEAGEEVADALAAA